MSAAANALRVARTAPSLDELVRIATGEPKADAVPDVPDRDATVRIHSPFGARPRVTHLSTGSACPRALTLLADTPLAPSLKVILLSHSGR